MRGPLDADDLIAVADHCVASLAPFVDRDWTVAAGDLSWSCRETLEHLGSLSYAPLLALRATEIPRIAFTVFPQMPVDWLLVTAQANAVILAEVARAAGPEVRAFHPAGMADPSGYIAMMGDEFVLHTNDIASALGVAYQPEAHVVRALLDRLFPWWPRDCEPWDALLWANGRRSLPSHPSVAGTWLWHCAPVDEWDGTIPEWDPVTRAKVRH